MHVLEDGICVTCRSVAATEHVLVDGVCTTCPVRTVARFDPTEPRDPHSGKWTDGPGGAIADVAGDALKLAERIELGDGERLVGSGRFEPTSGIDVDIVHAQLDSGGRFGQEVRLGFVASSDAHDWTGAAQPGETVRLTPDEVSDLRNDLTDAGKRAKSAAKKADAEWEAGSPSAISRGEEPAASGHVGDGDDRVNWSAYLTDDEPVSWYIAVEPNGASDTADTAHLTPKDLGRFTTLLGTLSDA